jgi:hypothetical protein
MDGRAGRTTGAHQLGRQLWTPSWLTDLALNRAGRASVLLGSLEHAREVSEGEGRVGGAGAVVGRAGEEERAAERAGGLALVDPLVDARLVEGVRTVAELADAVPRLERAQAHGARGRCRGAAGPEEVGVPDGGEAGLDGGRRGRRRRRGRLQGRRQRPEVRRRGRVGRVVVGGRRRGEAKRGEAEQDGVPEQVQQLQHQDERLRQDHAVAHRREPHGRPGLPASFLFLERDGRKWSLERER